MRFAAERQAVRDGALPESFGGVVGKRLFGHVRGAFTGAVQSTEGKVSAAKGGMLLFDEIGDLPLALRPKL